MRTHTSPRAIETIRPVDQDGVDHKPKGFWWEVNADWRRWNRDEQCSFVKPGYLIYKVVLDRAANVLRLNTVKEIDAFHEQYRASLFPGSHRDYIDWRKVAKDYDGVEITPYQWGRRLQGDASSWYYSWDCASGVIWNPRNTRVELVGTVERELVSA